MRRHAQRRERRAELVRNRGHQIVFELVEPAQARHILEDHRRPLHAPLLGVDRRRSRQQPPLALRRLDGHRLAKVLGRVGAATRQHMAAHAIQHFAHRWLDAAQRLGGAVRKLCAQQRFGRLIDVENAAGRVEDHHRIGNAVDRALRRMLRLLVARQA